MPENVRDYKVKRKMSRGVDSKYFVSESVMKCVSLKKRHHIVMMVLCRVIPCPLCLVAVHFSIFLIVQN